MNTNPNPPYGNDPGNHPYTQPSPKKNGCLIAGLIGGGVFLVVVVILIVAIFSSLMSNSSGASVNYSGNDGYIAVLHIEGAIESQSSAGLFSPVGYDHEYLMDSVGRLINDPDNKGMMLYIDSPGGEVYATDELYLRIMDYKEQTGRPVYAYCASVAASGGYYLAAGADQILMNRNCMTGSIGVTAGTFIDVSEFLEKNGIKTTSVHVGNNKAMGSYFEEFTEEQKQLYISVLEETYDQFVGVVAEGRGMNVEEVEYLADGRIYSPKQALDNGLIDGIMRYNDAVHQFINDMNWSEQTQVIDFEPLPAGGLESLFILLSESRKSDLETYLAHVDNPIEGFAYYCEALG